MNVGTAAGNVVELRTLISESSSFKCFVFKNIGWLCIELMALFLFNAQELLQVGGGHRLHCSDAACSGGPSERSPTCLNSSYRCWCCSCQILFYLHWGLINGTRQVTPKGRRAAVARRRRTVTRTAASTSYVTACVNWAGHVVLEPTVPAAVPTPISVLRRRVGPLVSYLKVLPVDNPLPATPRPLESGYILYVYIRCNKVCMCVCVYVCIQGVSRL